MPATAWRLRIAMAWAYVGLWRNIWADRDFIEDSMFDGKGKVPWTENETNARNFYLDLRAQIQHEDNLSNNRMTWLIAIQAFLFAAYGASLGAQAVLEGKVLDIGNAVDAKSFLDRLSESRVALAGLGVIFSLMILISLLAAALSISRLVYRWYEAPYRIRRYFPQIVGNSTKRAPGGTYLGQMPLFTFPVFCILMWGYFSNNGTLQYYLSVTAGTLALAAVLILFGRAIEKYNAKSRKIQEQEELEDM